MENYPSIKDHNKLILGVTGASGFIGKKVVETLANSGHAIIAFGRGETFSHSESCIQYFKGDLKNSEDVREFISRIDVCIHLAGVLAEDEKNVFSDNVLFASNLVDAILADGARVKLLNVSSLAVFNNKGSKILESTRYSKSKLKSDLEFDRAISRGLNLSTLYLGLVYGEGDKKFLPVIVKSLEGMRFGGINLKLMMFKGSKGPSPLISVDDVASLVKEILAKDRFSGEKFLGIGNDKSLFESLCMVSDFLNLKHPTYIKFKMPALLLANLIEKLCGLTGKKTPIFISVRTISVLGLNLGVDSQSFDHLPDWNPRHKLGEELPRLLN